MLFLKKVTFEGLKCCFAKNVVTCFWNFCLEFDKKARDFTTYLATEMRHCLQTLIFVEVFLLQDRFSTCFEDDSQ